MTNKSGVLSINSDNIFPIIKKWLYSDQDIFVREIISNGCDAITKLKKLEIIGKYTYSNKYESKINIIIDSKNKILEFIDNGIGMTTNEVEKYITQIAFSGATEFFKKYKDKTDNSQIIGHFGLGFYSVFMVADKVYIDTLSYKKNSTPVHWECYGGNKYTITNGNYKNIGTKITLFLNKDSLEFVNEYRIKEIIKKYCSFMPVKIFLIKLNAKQEYEIIDKDELKKDDVIVEHIHEKPKTKEKINKNGKKEIIEISPAKDKIKINKRLVPLNDTNPLWLVHPSKCTSEKYKNFYRKVFFDYREPLFWIHLNMDYPFNLKGILYFPKINIEYESIEGNIKLYNNQVFVADNIKEVIPEFLMLLKGVIDCPDLPLNVSRSSLQNNGFVKKISNYITKKIADKLSGMCKTNRNDYEKYWDDISPFIKFGCLKNMEFSKRIIDYILYKDINNKYLILNDFVETNKKHNINDNKNTKIKDNKINIYYVTNKVQQSQYIHMFKKQNQNAIIMDHNIDSAFITHVEQNKNNIKFLRIDSKIDNFVRNNSESFNKEANIFSKLFKKILNKDKLIINVKKLKNTKISSMIIVSEENKRMQEMMKMYNNNNINNTNMLKNEQNTLILNINNKLIQYILNDYYNNNKLTENSILICHHLYDLALLNNRQFSSNEMTNFISRSNDIMLKLIK